MNHAVKAGSPVYFSSFINYLLNIKSNSKNSTLSNNGGNVGKDVSFNVGRSTAKKYWIQALSKKNNPSDLIYKVLYKEKTASGFSHKDWYTKVGAVNVCLTLEIVGDILRVTPSSQYPGLTELLDLEHKIKADSIIDISEKVVAFKDTLLIKYSDNDDVIHKIEIMPKYFHKFRTALKEMMLYTNN